MNKPLARIKVKHPLRRLWRRVAEWWSGRYVPPGPDGPFILGYYDKHWTSKLVHRLVAFYLQYWQWLWGMTVVILLALYTKRP